MVSVKAHLKLIWGGMLVWLEKKEDGMNNWR
jgi:hypothetical protein